jgi:hypothetical protein
MSALLTGAASVISRGARRESIVGVADFISPQPDRIEQWFAALALEVMAAA